jgi:hypothetical protein
VSQNIKKLKKMSLAGGNANALPLKKEFGISFPMCDKLGEECRAIPDLAPAWNKDFVCKHPRLRA